MNRFLITLLGIVVASQVSAAEGPTGIEAQRCANSSELLDIRIGACTTVIQAGGMEDAELAKVLFNRGSAYEAKQQHDLALKDLDASVKLKPDLVGSFVVRGDVFRAKGQFDKAILDYDQALSLNPSAEAAYFGRGVAHASRNQFGLAGDDFRAALSRNPSLTGASLNLGVVYLRDGRFEDAIESFNMVLARDSTFDTAYNGRGYAYLSLGRTDDAIRDFGTAIHLKADLAPAYRNRALAYVLKDDHQHAIVEYRDLIARSPRDVLAHAGRGWLRFLENRLDDATRNLRTAYDLQKSNAELALWTAVGLGRTGKDDLGFLTKAAPSINLGKWPGPIVQAFLGRLGPAEAIKLADNEQTLRASLQRQDAHFFWAEKLLMEGKKQEAAEEFRLSLAADSAPSYMSLIAKMEIQRLSP
jgi:lipoprotein NlpI